MAEGTAATETSAVAVLREARTASMRVGLALAFFLLEAKGGLPVPILQTLSRSTQSPEERAVESAAGRDATSSRGKLKSPAIRVGALPSLEAYSKTEAIRGSETGLWCTTL
jgi:hypothetical protein